MVIGIFAVRTYPYRSLATLGSAKSERVDNAYLPERTKTEINDVEGQAVGRYIDHQT